MKRRKDNVLAEGEVTGHAHVANGEGVAVFGDGVKRELRAPQGARVTHEEHKPITLPKGDFDIGRVLEYDHFAEEARNVAD